MKKMSKAMYGKTMMQDGGMTRAEKKEARQGRKARTKELINQGLITPIEGVKLRMQAAKERRKEANQKMQDGGPIDAMRKQMGEKKTSTRKTLRYVKKHGSGYIPPSDQKVEAPKTYKTGGMVNSNAKVSADKTPGSKGVKSGTNPKASASKVAKGRVGGTSAAPKKAKP